MVFALEAEEQAMSGADRHVRSPVTRWFRLGISGIAAVLLLVLTASDGVYILLSAPIDPVRINGRLIRLDEHCFTGSFECAYLDVDRFCYRISPEGFRPPMPPPTNFVGRRISFVVDRRAYESSRWVGDPMCNFQVAQISVVIDGTLATYSTSAASEPQYVGHSRSELEWSGVGHLGLLAALVIWNVTAERRRRPAGAAGASDDDAGLSYSPILILVLFVLVALIPITIAVSSAGASVRYGPALLLIYLVQRILARMGIFKRKGAAYVVDEDLVTLNLNASSSRAEERVPESQTNVTGV
jgi:hypothetical protein